MKQQTNPILFLLAIIACITGCTDKNNPACNPDLKPEITFDATVTAGTSLNLSVSGIDNVYMYNWRGPNGFSSHEQEPIVPNMSAATAGRYIVDVVTKDGCIHTAATDSIIVSGAQPGCSVGNNKLDLSASGIISFSVIYGAGGGGSYTVTANGSGGNLSMEFYGTARPNTGVYNVTPVSGFWSPGYVRVSVTSFGQLWYPADGKVNVVVTGGKPVISFCNLDFKASGYYYTSKGSAQITLP